MPRHLILLLLAPSVLLSGQAKPAPAPAATATISGATIHPAPAGFKFPIGQTFTYTVEWRLFTAGTATVRIDNAGRELRVTTTADAGGVVAVLYRVHDRVEAFFDPQTFCSRAVAKHTEEGRRRLETAIVFDYARGKSVLDEKKENQSKHEENDIPACVTDVVSSIFYIAAQPLKPDSSFLLPLNDGGRTADVTVTVEGRETVKTPAGDFPAIRVRAQSNTGKLKEKGAIWIWYTDDAARSPVQMRARLFWGSLLFRLTKP